MTKCLSNLGQIGYGVKMYVDDHRETYPPGDSQQFNPSAPYVSHGNSLGGTDPRPDWRPAYPMARDRFLTPYVPARETWHCPADRGLKFRPYTVSANSYSVAGSSYRFSWDLQQSYVKAKPAIAEDPGYNLAGKKENWAPEPSRFIAMGEAATYFWDIGDGDPEAGTIFPHIGSAAVYRCPADRSKVEGTSLHRTRSYSIEGWLNAYYTAKGLDFGPDFYPWTKLRLSEVLDPPPSGVFAFIDEHEQSIDAGVFVLEQPPEVITDSTTGHWYSLPADRHQQGCNLSFLDGHVEHWPWQTPKVFRQFLVRATHDRDDLRRLQRALPHNKTPKPVGGP